MMPMARPNSPFLKMSQALPAEKPEKPDAVVAVSDMQT